MKKMYFCVCRNQESTVYHIFKCKINFLSRNCYFIDTKSVCNDYTLSTTNHECFIDCMTLKEAREQCALMANGGEKICPECVSKLYK